MSTERHKGYRGFKPYTVDSKGRVAVQPAWRPDADETVYLLFSNTKGVPMLKVLTQAGYDERVEIIKASALSEGKKREMLGELAALSREVSINEQGKLAIPKDLCEVANITPDSEVMQVGREGHFEIWNKDAWDAQLAELMKTRQAQTEADDLGVF